MADINQENLIEEQKVSVSFEGTKKILFQMENCICKIYLKNEEKGTGFFCKIPFNNNLLPVLITNNHVLNENNIEDNEIIKLTINKEVKEIKLDSLRKKYTNSDKQIDITIIEIRQKIDGINDYLELEENEFSMKNIELEYKKKSTYVYILHYLKGELNVTYDLIDDIIDNKRANHYYNKEESLSCSPIISLKIFKVIGIYIGNSQIKEMNNGVFIKYAIDLFNIFNRNEIDIAYETKEEGYNNIFGDKFVENNKNNIELIINGNKNNLIKEYNLKKGENKIKIIRKLECIKWK